MMSKIGMIKPSGLREPPTVPETAWGSRKRGLGYSESVLKIVRRASDDKRSVHIIAFLCAVMLDLVVPVATQVVETQAIGLRINDC
jgi:hypothetical protein